MKATLRASRLSLAIKRVALPFRAASSALASSGRSGSLASLDFDKRRHYGPAMLAGERLDRDMLGFQPDPTLTLPNGANPQIDNECGGFLRHPRIPLHTSK